MYNNNFNHYNNFLQAYQIYSNALQYVMARQTYINETINKIDIEVKKRLQNLDKILADYYELYVEIEKESARYVNYKATQDEKMARIEEEVKKVRILLENKTGQDEKIGKLEEEIKKLRIWQEANENQVPAMERAKAENREKTSSLPQTQNVNNDEYVNDFVNSKRPTKAKVASTFILSTQPQKTKDDNANDFINSKISTKAKAEHATRVTQAQKTDDGNVNGFVHCKQRTKVKTKVGTRLLNQSQMNNDINMNSLRTTKEKTKYDIGNSTGSSMQSEKIISGNVKDFPNSECKSCRMNDKNLVATKGKNWNNHNINTWLEQKLHLNVKDEAWKLTVFGEYKHIEFTAPEYKQFLWQNRDKWEEEGVWLWFEC